MTGIKADQDKKRPTPEALLEKAAAEARGKLKIFLGAAPGVGKTYEMLNAAAQRKREGVDVVIGVVETHGRAETEALTRGLDAVPRRVIDYKGRILTEMDIDAVLKRRPGLVLVDELAHTNAPGSRHPKRYQDVEELIEAGIDVYTTLNIQHVESLNDVVEQITRIRVRETVPDSIIDRADEIEIIDITPADLIKRLHEGKVYVRDQAQRALRHYFAPGNLTALRELALRRTAQRVDEQMVNYMQAHAIAGPWATSERVLVCIDEDPRSAGLVRYARRSADRLKANWIAFYVETSRDMQLSPAGREQIAETMRLAETLGGEVVRVHGDNIAREVLAYARENNITQIILGRTTQPVWRALWGKSVVHELIRDAGAIGVHIVPGESTGGPLKRVRIREEREALDPLPYVFSTLTVAGALAVAFGLERVVTIPNISLVFLAAILYTAVNYGLWPSLYASLISTLAYNFFFLPPLYTFTIADPANVLALIFFTIVAVLTSNLTARTRRQVMLARAQIKTTSELNSFSRKLVGIGDLDDLLWAAAFQIASMLKLRVVFMFPEGQHMSVAAAYPPDDVAGDAELAAARWAWDHERPAGRGSDTLPGAERLFLPIRTASAMLGVVGLDREEPGPLFTTDERRLLDALLDQIAVSIERIRLSEDIDNARIMSETERLRSALLTSISHDLRTPLASIIGAITSLRSYFDRYGREEREELMATIEDEAQRLNRFVGNLLDITRLESGALDMRTSRIEIAELVETALRRAGRMLAAHRVEVDIQADLPPVEADPVLLEQALFNLLDNASKYAPAGTRIGISAEAAGREVIIRIADEGEGIPPEDIEAIFDKFRRARSGDRRPAGTGLGLAVCRGFVEAFGGSVSANNKLGGRGAIFTVRLPAAARPDAMTAGTQA
ncbi:MAG: sensor histidine kinase KdpD [Parvibaculum sp.]|uniref:sensor histidine kinase KdpD n=1 Tax=Parvibaculum sp. TaxID=2024848 RepID=UPI00283EE07D|nr:sensor histidine kinase KdpD [Parvibaculum sp.]MDR3499645.1 sensor histidine kinase KdpD [Parvibaculum sp.]